MTKCVAVIPARGGSKGIPNKNIIEICGKPLIAWSILNALQSDAVDSVWVTSDSETILDIAKDYGAETIERPNNLSNDSATSESAWLHALDIINTEKYPVEYIVGMQATSPIRGLDDISNALDLVKLNKLDSLLSVTEIEDNFIWELRDNKMLSVNYDFNDRKRRQVIDKKYLENGSFYIFKPKVLKNNNRLGGKIGVYAMEKHKMFQIDNQEDIKLCESILSGYGYLENE